MRTPAGSALSPARRIACLSLVLVLVLVLVLGAACSRPSLDRFDWVVAHYDAGGFAHEVNAADPAVARQRLWGFYPSEGAGWSWTSDHFAVAVGPLRPVLRLRFSFSPSKERTEVTIGASINGRELRPETYSTAGDLEYLRELDFEEVRRPAKIELSVAPTWKAPGGDLRALGVVVRSVAIEAR